MARFRQILLCLLCASVGAVTAHGQDYKSYQNYDFVPGDKIIFEDDFAGDRDGEFPAHWKLLSGQGAVNKVAGAPALSMTEGNYAKVEPRIKTASYLADTFTVEFDFFPKAGGSEKLIVFLKSGDDEGQVVFGSETSLEGVDKPLSGRYPGESDAFPNKWHHAALVLKGRQLKVYEDQYRVLVVPDVDTLKPTSVSFGGIADADFPLLLRNVRIANGGGMTMLDRLTKDGRIVTHGILFDVNKSIVKPESMGTIREIEALLKADPALKLEVGGHTDSDGDAAKNVTLSQARADAVAKVLVELGVDASRLSAKGYGAAKPIDSNASPEGKANNRRVEFTKGS